jgi:general secretion pathway protein D
LSSIAGDLWRYFGAIVLLGCLLAGGCSIRPNPENGLLQDMSTTDLSAQAPTRVKQSVAPPQDPRSKQAAIFPGDERATAPGGGRPKIARNTVQANGDGYQLNFEDASLADVVKAVLGDTLRVPYQMNQRVQGQITLSTGRAVSRTELLKVLEAALKMNNAALITDGSNYSVVPIAEAVAGDVGSIEPLKRGEGAIPGYGVTVMPLRHVAAEAMMRLLEGFMARAGTVRAEITGNLLLVRGGSRERDHITDVIDTFDVDWLKGQSAGVFPLVHASPEPVIQELNVVMQNEQPSLTANMVRFQAISRLNAVLVVTRRFEHLQKVGSWIRRLDRFSTGGKNYYVYQVENGKAADIALLLNDMYGTGAVGQTRRPPRSEIAPGRDITQSSSSGSSGFGAGGSGGTQGLGSGSGTGGGLGGGLGGSGGLQGGATRPGTGSNSATGVGSSASSQASRPGGLGSGAGGGTNDPDAPDVRIIADEANNSLLIRAKETEYQRILTLLRQIDRPPLQVLINATIAEVTLNNALRYGVQAYLKFAHGSHGSIGYHPGPNDLTLKPGFPGLNLLLGNVLDPRLVLDALSNVTNVKVVSSPSVVVVDNQPATLKVGDEVPIATQQVQSVIDSQAPIINSIRFRETGVILKVTPRVNSSGLVTMEVEQEISQVAGSGTAAAATSSLTPTISQRRIASTISVYSGQTVVLGGLISEQDNTDKKSVPLVNRVPIVGDLLGSNSVERRRTELIVFISPQVIRNSEDASRLSHEMRDKLRSMAFEIIQHHDRRPGWDAGTRTVRARRDGSLIEQRE